MIHGKPLHPLLLRACMKILRCQERCRKSVKNYDVDENYSSGSLKRNNMGNILNRNGWFETVAEAQRRARRRLPSSVSSALLAGSEKGITYNDNTAAFSELGLAPHVVGMHATRDLTTSVMGQAISLPVIISPAGVQAVHPDGEVAVARAAASRGTVMGLSSFASKPVEEVVTANPRTFFQLYWSGTRETMIRRMDRARSAGAKGRSEEHTSELQSPCNIVCRLLLE